MEVKAVQFLGTLEGSFLFAKKGTAVGLANINYKTRLTRTKPITPSERVALLLPSIYDILKTMKFYTTSSPLTPIVRVTTHTIYQYYTYLVWGPTPSKNVIYGWFLSNAPHGMGG